MTHVIEELLGTTEDIGQVARVIRCLEASGDKWLVRVLRFGESKNGWIWDQASGKQMLPHLANAPVGLYQFKSGTAGHASAEAQLAADGPVMRNIVADLQEPRVEPDGVYATLHVHEDAGWLKQKLLGLDARGVLDKVIGLSVDTLSGYVPVQMASGVKRAIREIHKLHSVDIVTRPSADGRFLRATASAAGEWDLTECAVVRLEERAMDPETKTPEPVKESVQPPKQLELGATAEQLSKMQATAREAEQTLKQMQESEKRLATAQAELAKTQQAIDITLSDRRVREAVEASPLPVPYKTKLVRQLSGAVREAAAIEAAIKEETETWAAASPTQDPRGFGGRPRIELGPTSIDKIQVGLDRLLGVTRESWDKAMKNSYFDGLTLARINEAHMKPHDEAAKDRGLEFTSLRQFYVEMTGDTDVTGFTKKGRASEATGLTTTWADALGVSMYRKLLQTFAEPTYNERSIARFGSAPDFRTRDAIVLGYLPDIAAVAEDAAYVDIVLPSDEKVQYAVTKRGNLLPVSRETIINDDIRTVATLIERFGRASRRTLAQFVWNFWIGNSLWDVDGVAWFAAFHGNTGTTALTADAAGSAEVFAKISQLGAQLERSSGKMIGAPALDSLWLDVPMALWSVARRLNISPEWGAGVTNQVYALFGSPTDPGGSRINVNPLFTDATDWGVHMAPGSGGRESIWIDFLGGREEPEFFLQDQPTVGATFTNDRVTYKLRFEWGGDIVDVQAATKNIVA